MAKILVVDDNDQVRYMEQVLLETHGHQVFTAHNGVEALELGHRHDPDLVVTDILMPDMDGFTLCRNWISDDQLRGVPIIFYTATYTDDKDEELALSLGATRFIRKPTEPDEIIRVIEEVLANRDAIKTPSPPPPPSDDQYLRQYNAALVRKLERKVEQLEMTRASVDQAATPVLWVDSSGTIDYANPAAASLLGCQGDELSGQHLWQRQVGLTADTWHRDFWQPLQTHGARTVATDWTSVDGRTIPVEVAANYWERGGRSHAVLFVTDVTERRAVEEQLRRAQRMRAMGRVASGIAHDFNNLLTAMQGFLGLIARRLPPDSGVGPEVEELQNTVERASNLTQQLLAFGRQQVLHPATLDLNEVVTEFAGVIKQALRGEAELELSLARDVGLIRADRGQLEQVLMNLAINARDAMPDGGTIVLTTARGANDACLSVIDHGVGMDEETRARLFEPFFTTKPPGKGTGLGMATVYGIVEQSGGRIEVASTPGEGTRIDLYLPAALPDG